MNIYNTLLPKTIMASRCSSLTWTTSVSKSFFSTATVSQLRTFLYERDQSTGPVTLDGESLTIADLKRLSFGETLIVSPSALDRVRKTESVIQNALESGQPVYGINTGFGSLSSHHVSMDQLNQLQENLIRSHATGVGERLEIDMVRRIMALRINTLLKGVSGISERSLMNLVKVFNSGCVPELFAQGTVGASGDLIPLSHIALGALLGEGQMWCPMTKQFDDATSVLKRHHLEKTQLKPKEGLALINGTQFISGLGSKAFEMALHSFRLSMVSSAMTVLAMKGYTDAFDPRVSKVRPHSGQAIVAEFMNHSLQGISKQSYANDVQDPYSLRCVPQVLGSVLEALYFVSKQLSVEFNSGTCNPLIFPHAPHFISQGNFHGEYPAKAMDMLSLYCHELGSISYARVMSLLDVHKSRGLPPFLTQGPGLNSGLMQLENVVAALLAENQVLVSPASTNSLPTCAGKEDHVSMGGYAARKALQLLQNSHIILSTELYLSSQAILIRQDQDPNFSISEGLTPFFNHLKSFVRPLGQDRYIKPEFDELSDFLKLDHILDPFFENQNQAKEPSRYAIKQRPFQTVLGELEGMRLDHQLSTLTTLQEKIRHRLRQHPNSVFILDVSQDDLGALANYGRGHDNAKNLVAYDLFLARALNAQVNVMSKRVLDRLCLLGSVDLTDIRRPLLALSESDPTYYSALSRGVKQVDDRARSIVKTIFEMHPTGMLLYLNGDHNNMTSIIGGYYLACSRAPVLIYLDHHADSRPYSGEPHSGNWCVQMHEKKWLEKAYVVGLNPLSNSDATLTNLVKHNVSFEPYTWDQLMSGKCSLVQCAQSIVDDINASYPGSPIILSVCSDTVMGLPASASNHAIGYEVEGVYRFLSTISSQLQLSCFNIAELKPSLASHEGSVKAVGEFLTQSIYLVTQNQHERDV